MRIFYLKNILYHLQLKKKIYLDDEIPREILKLPTIGELRGSRRDRTTRVETVIEVEDHGQL